MRFAVWILLFKYIIVALVLCPPMEPVKGVLWTVIIQTFVNLETTFQNGELFALETYNALCEMSDSSCVIFL